MKLPLLFLFGLLPVTFGLAEQFDRSSVRALCARADAIVVGTVVEGDLVHIEKWIRPEPSSLPLPDTITISRLSQHLRKLDWHFSGIRDAADLPLRRFVAFLEGKHPTWECVSTVADDPARPEVGSSGLFWILDRKCYAYAQYGNPGPYGLGSVEALTKNLDPGWFPYHDWLEPVTTEALLLSEIEAGLNDLAAWKATLAEQDPHRKAERLAAYFLPSTSPVGLRKTVLFEIEPPFSELGDAATPALVKALESRRPGEDLTALLWTLRRIPTNTEAAIPALSEMLGHPLARPPSIVFDCLGHTQSPQITAAVWPFLFSPYPEVRAEAVFTLLQIAPENPSPAKIAQQSPFAAIVRLLPLDAQDPPDSHPGSVPLVRAYVKENLKGLLPKRFVIWQAPESSRDNRIVRHPGGLAIVFLRQDGPGHFILSTPDSCQEYRAASDRIDWPREHSIPLGRIREVLETSPDKLSLSGS